MFPKVKLSISVSAAVGFVSRLHQIWIIISAPTVRQHIYMPQWRLVETLWPFFLKHHVRNASPLRPQTARNYDAHACARTNTPRLHPVAAELLLLIKPTRSACAKTARRCQPKQRKHERCLHVHSGTHATGALCVSKLCVRGTITHYWSVISGCARAAAPIGPQPAGVTSLICCVRPRWCPEIPAWASQLRIREGFLFFNSTFPFTSRWHPFEYLYGYNFMVDLHFITDMKWRRKETNGKNPKCFVSIFSPKVTRVQAAIFEIMVQKDVPVLLFKLTVLCRINRPFLFSSHLELWLVYIHFSSIKVFLLTVLLSDARSVLSSLRRFKKANYFSFSSSTVCSALSPPQSSRLLSSISA